MDHGMKLFFAIFWGAIAFASLLFWRSAVKRSHAVNGIPTSKCRSAAQGYVKLEGRQKAIPNHQLTAPLTGKPCTWWRYRIEERIQSQNGKHHEWSTLRQATSPDFILLDDGTGQVMVNPIDAEVIQWRSDTWFSDKFWPEHPPMTNADQGRYRYTESRMNEGDMLFVTGEFTTHAAQSGLTRAPATAFDVLVKWKRDQTHLWERFDTDHDGAIDTDEWNKARDAAAVEAKTRAVAKPAVVTPEVNMVVKRSDGRPFVLSPYPIEADAPLGTSSGKVSFALFVFSCVALLWLLYRHH
jgi:hypothetical protein